MTAPPAGTLRVANRPAAAVDLNGVWYCADDHEWEDVLNVQFGAGAELLGPSVLTRGARALATAKAKTPGAEIEIAADQTLPAHVLS